MENNKEYIVNMAVNHFEGHFANHNMFSFSGSIEYPRFYSIHWLTKSFLDLERVLGLSRLSECRIWKLEASVLSVFKQRPKEHQQKTTND